MHNAVYMVVCSTSRSVLLSLRLRLGDPATLLAACQDLCDPLPGCAGIVTELAHVGGSCWAVSGRACAVELSQAPPGI
jgi:hypothetical protein